MNRFILPFLLLTAITLNGFATNWVAADLIYRCLGGNNYEVSLSFYRDCSGAAAPDSVNIEFECTGDSTQSFSYYMKRIANTGQEVTPGCCSGPSRCSAPPPARFGVQEFIYRANVVLVACNFWRISYRHCCRNHSNTVHNPTNNYGYIKASLNNLLAPCKSSPTYTNKPITLLCKGLTSCFNHGALDYDGDSLSYELTHPLTNFNTPLIYLGGYTYLQPLVSIPPVSCNPVTGDICVTPPAIMTTVMAVLIKQYRTINGVPTVVGTSMRDLQIRMLACYNHNPVLSGMDTTLSQGYDSTNTMYYLETCFGKAVNFNIWGYDADKYDPNVPGNPEKFSISWNNGIPDGTFTAFHNGTDSAYANFQWTPTANDISNIPKYFAATIQDHASPYYGANTYFYYIFVRGSWVDLGKDTLLCKGEVYTITAIADSNTVNYYWKVNGIAAGVPTSSNTFVFNANNYSYGVHTVSVETDDGTTIQPCKAYGSINIEIVPGPDIGQISGPVVTPPHSNTYYSITLNPPAHKNWEVIGGTIFSGQNFNMINVNWGYSPYGKVILTATDSTLCATKDTLNVTIGYVGTNEKENFPVKVYPNPASEKIYFEAGDESYRGFTIEIMDIQGRITGVYTTVASRLEVDISKLPQGLYFYRMKNLNGEFLVSGSFSHEKNK